MKLPTLFGTALLALSSAAFAHGEIAPPAAGESVAALAKEKAVKPAHRQAKAKARSHARAGKTAKAAEKATAAESAD